MEKKVKAVRSRISELESEIIILKNAIRNEEKRSVEVIHDYEYSVEIFNENEEDEFIVVMSGLAKEFEDLRGLYNEHIKTFGNTIIFPSEVRKSVEYYRKYGVLFSRGIGHASLKDGVMCSKKEWEEIKDWNIKKFLNK